MTLIRASKGGGGGSAPTEADDTLSSTAYAQILDIISEGPIFGFPEGKSAGQCIFFDGTPLQNGDGSYNFKLKQFDYRLGYVDQDYIPGFESSSSEKQVGVALTTSSPWSQTITNTDINAVRVTLGVNSLSKTDTSTGNVTGYRVAYQIQLSKDGGSFSTVLDTAFDGKASSTYTRSHRIELSGAKSQYTLRVVRLTPDSTTQYVQDKTNVVSYAELIDAKLRYPFSALVALMLDAEQFSSMPVRSYDVKGLLVKCPSNYNPQTRQYVGVWDGTFVIGCASSRMLDSASAIQARASRSFLNVLVLRLPSTVRNTRYPSLYSVIEAMCGDVCSSCADKLNTDEQHQIFSVRCMPRTGRYVKPTSVSI